MFSKEPLKMLISLVKVFSQCLCGRGLPSQPVLRLVKRALALLSMVHYGHDVAAKQKNCVHCGSRVQGQVRACFSRISEPTWRPDRASFPHRYIWKQLKNRRVANQQQHQRHMIHKARLFCSNMVVSLAELCLPLIIYFLCGFGTCSLQETRVYGLRLEDVTERVFMRERVILAPHGTTFKLRLFGSYLSNETWPWVAFAAAGDGSLDPCAQEEHRNSSAFRLRGAFAPGDENSGIIEVQTVAAASNLENKDALPVLHHFCVLKGQAWGSVGSDKLAIKNPDVPSDYIPLWGLILVVVLLVLVCSVVRCVNLSLLWLDPLELYVLHSCGSEDEKRAAKRLKPIRRRGNVLVCSLLFICALGHSVLGVLLYRLYGSILPSVFTSAFLLFLLAELVPHIVCSGYGFQMAPGLIWLAQICLILTCPLSCPLGLLLDLILHRDVSTVGIREKTMEMIRTSVNDPYNEFVKVEFSKGALRTKTVDDILTPLKDCFMLPSTAVLDFNTMSEIMQSSYTRVPVYEEERSNIITKSCTSKTWHWLTRRTALPWPPSPSSTTILCILF